MLIGAAELVEQRPEASRDDIRRHLSGNYCRCTGYQAIVDAVETVCRARGPGRSGSGVQ
jgi:carbon-monoxide dehydrogenase small subunit